MPSTILIILLFSLLIGCKENAPKVEVAAPISEEVPVDRPMLRYISFFGTDEDFGIELNGDRAFLKQEGIEPRQIEIPYKTGLRLLEDFYSIPDIESFRGKDSDNRQTSIHYLIVVRDEMPERYSKEWVDYVFLKDQLESLPDIKKWFDRMYAMKEKANKS